MESADFRSICQETIQTILKKEQQLEYAMKGSGCQPLNLQVASKRSGGND
jgi:hypothetical protein